MPRQTADDDESSSSPRQFTARRPQSKAKKQELSNIESAAASWQLSCETPRSLGIASLPAIDRESSRQDRRKQSKQSSELSGIPVSGQENSIPLPARYRSSRSDELCDGLPADLGLDQAYTVGAMANAGVEDTLINPASKKDSQGYVPITPASLKADSFRGSGRRFSKKSTGQARFNTAGASRHPSKESAGMTGRANPEGSLRGASKESVGAGRAWANTDSSVLYPTQETAGSRGIRNASKQSSGASIANTDERVPHPSQGPAGSRGQAASNTEGPCNAVSSFATQPRRRPSKASSQVCRQEGSRQASKEAVVVSNGVRQQAMSLVGEVPIHELADIHRDHRTEAPKSSPAWLPQNAREAAASSTACDADEAWTSPSETPRASILGARLLLSDEILGGGSVDVPTNSTARERWESVRRRTSQIRSMFAEEAEEVSVSDEVILGQLDDSLPLPKRAETRENVYWNRLWDLGKLQRLHVADEDSCDSSAPPDNLPEFIAPLLPVM